MGREIKRVAMDFDYPINKMIWKGYANPYRGLECKVCEGTGESQEVKKLSEDWYGFDRPQDKWCDKITDDEAKALFDEGRLRDFDECPTGEQVNEWAKTNILGHDCVNKWICVETRAKRLGIKEMECNCCKGKGVLWPDEKYEKLADEFEYIEPPAGEGYQLWSTTTEGTPMSPVFATPEALAEWLADTRASSFGSNTCTYEQWLSFINGPGWAPSMIANSSGVRAGVDYDH